MKRIITILLTLWSSVALAQAPEYTVTLNKLLNEQLRNKEIRRIRKTVEKHWDIPSDFDYTQCKELNDFWIATVNKNKDYNAYSKAKGRLAKDTRALFNDYIQYINYANQGRIREYLEDDELWDAGYDLFAMAAGDDHRLRCFFIDYDDVTLNASMNLCGDVTFTFPLWNLLDKDELIGILAHEVAHFMLRHSEVQDWKEKKRIQSNQIAAGIAVGLTAIADGLAVANGVQIDQYSRGRYYADLFYYAEADAIRGKYAYSREKETEADIIATRLLKYLGIDPLKYANALSKIMEYENEQELTTGLYDTHPSMISRIRTVIYVAREWSIHR